MYTRYFNHFFDAGPIYTALYRIGRRISHSWADFPCSMSPRLEYSRCPKEVGVRKRAFRRRIYRSVVAPSWVVEQPSLEKNAPGGGGDNAPSYSVHGSSANDLAQVCWPDRWCDGGGPKTLWRTSQQCLEEPEQPIFIKNASGISYKPVFAWVITNE